MSDLLPISVLVQTKNEEIGIATCLEGLSDFSEVIVVDSNSIDKTKDIVREFGHTVVNFTWNGAYPKKKQWQLDNVETKYRWILYMDADETPSEDLIGELRNIDFTKSNDMAAYEIPLEYVFSGRSLKYGHRVVKRALVHKDRVNFPVIKDLEAPGMGELEGHYQPTSHGRVGRLIGKILHDDKDPVRTWFDRHNRYSDWEAFLRVNSQTKKSIAMNRSRQGNVFDRVPFKPLAFFIYGYVIRQGFRDGHAGFDYAFALSTYYWQIGLKTAELRRNGENQ